MDSGVAWVLVSTGTQVQPPIIPDPDYLPDYFLFLMTMVITRTFHYKSVEVHTSASGYGIVIYILLSFFKKMFMKFRKTENC